MLCQLFLRCEKLIHHLLFLVLEYVPHLSDISSTLAVLRLKQIKEFAEAQTKEMNHRNRMHILLFYVDVHRCQFSHPSRTPTLHCLKHRHPSAILAYCFFGSLYTLYVDVINGWPLIAKWNACALESDSLVLLVLNKTKDRFPACWLFRSSLTFRL